MNYAIQQMNYEDLRQAEINITVGHRIRTLQIAIEKLHPELSKEWDALFDKEMSNDNYLAEIHQRMMLLR